MRRVRRTSAGRWAKAFRVRHIGVRQWTTAPTQELGSPGGSGRACLGRSRISRVGYGSRTVGLEPDGCHLLCRRERGCAALREARNGVRTSRYARGPLLTPIPRHLVSQRARQPWPGWRARPEETAAGGAEHDLPDPCADDGRRLYRSRAAAPHPIRWHCVCLSIGAIRWQPLRLSMSVRFHSNRWLATLGH